MSNAVSPLQGAVKAGDVTVSDLGLRGMVSLRADLNDPAVQAICIDITGAAFPAQNTMTQAGENGLCWMSPDEILLLTVYDDAPNAQDRLQTALSSKHHLATNVSDARASISVTGRSAREVIAKLAPIDLHPDSVQPGDFRRTRLGQVAAAFGMIDENTMHIICFRSVARYTFNLLAASASAGPVGVFTNA